MKVDILKASGNSVTYRCDCGDGTYIRKIITPLTDYSGEPASVQTLCQQTFTPTVVAAYTAEQEAAQVSLQGA